MGTVVEETQGASATSSIVDDLGYHRTVFLEEQLVADTYLARRLDEHVPQAQFLIQLAQQEHLDLCIGLFLCAVEACGEHLCVVEDEGVALVKVVYQVAERQVLIRVVAVAVLLEHLDGLALAVDNHQTALVAVVDAVHGTILILEGAVGRVECYLLLRELELEL